VLSVRALRGKNGQTTAITPEKAAPGDQKAQRDGENDRRIEELNNEIAAVRKENEANAARVRELEAQLADSSKALAAAQQKLKVAQRQAERPPIASAREKNLPAKTPAAPAPSQPPPAQTQTAQAPPAQAPPPPQRRVDEAGQYEVLRDTALLEKPSTSSREVALVQRGMTVNVVASVGDWLEVRSKFGKPPGYIRRQDVAPKQAQGNNNKDRF
jgi:hypothetical protein